MFSYVCILLSCFTIAVIAEDNGAFFFQYESSAEFTDSTIVNLNVDKPISLTNPFKTNGKNYSTIFVSGTAGYIFTDSAFIDILCRSQGDIIGDVYFRCCITFVLD
ncbi:uncharacterized protein LOC115921460 [Strongylocentrotus purpuratus]|uniref:Uncharacterized protein n=1 Tax=Strongylocentrotus purpuratus TaxID=7668 RepID=A0A7M7ND35_STRPU|nr:uncharacterized protein LOC115921460 [Strongylocentrotus purpuratus]